MCPSQEDQHVELPIDHWNALIEKAMAKGHSAELSGLILGLAQQMNVEAEQLLMADDPVDEFVITFMAAAGVDRTKKLLEIGRSFVACAERRLGEAKDSR